MYTCSDMVHLQRHRRQVRNRFLAYFLLAATIALTSTPVCGSVSDVDPVGCCERHACARTAASYNRRAQLRQSRGGCCSTNCGISGADKGAEMCCELGSLSYPKVNPQSSPALAIVLPFISTITIATLVPTTTHFREVDAKTLLKIPLIPLYTLNANYRI